MSAQTPQDAPDKTLDFLSGGGDMGARMRQHDWSRTPLGEPAQWPNSLRATVGILLHSRYPMFLAWGEQRTFFYNDAYAQILGAKHPRALGRAFRDIWADVWADVEPLVARTFAGESIWWENLQLFMRRHDFLEETYFTFSYSPVRGDDGQVAGLFCTCAETTREVVGERRLEALNDLSTRTAGARSAKEVCQRAVEVLSAQNVDLPFALFYLTGDEPGPLRLAAKYCDEVPGHLCPDSLPLVDMAEEHWPLAAALPRTRSHRASLCPELGLPGGPWEEPARDALCLPLKQRGGEELRGVLVLGLSSRLPADDNYTQFCDLIAAQVETALANAEAYTAERRRAEALAEIDDAKTIFFSNVSHEFRTPLSLILTPLRDVLDETGIDEPTRQQLTLAHRNALRLLKLVNSLLDFSRIEAGRMQAQREPTNLAELTRDLASNFRSACDKAGLELQVDCPPLPRPVPVDRDMWEKIVLNLLSNAFKFTLRGHIRVALHARGRQAVLEVSDSGVGIAPEHLGRLFERFARVEGSAGRTQEGSGIGLALVRELALLHEGSVEVESEPDRGSLFRVRLPLHAALPSTPAGAGLQPPANLADHAAPFVEEALRWLPADALDTLDAADSEAMLYDTLTGSEDLDGPPERVLIADDNADMRDYLQRLLAPQWRVELACDGQQALEMIQADPPDLLLTDVMMPRLNGLELARALRADERTAALPIVMLSARAGEEARIDGVRAGVNAYLVKPFSARELLARVGAQLALARIERERGELQAREREAQRLAALQIEHLESLFMQAPAPVVILRGREHIIELANEPTCQIWGRSHDEVIGRPMLDVIPELREQAFPELLRGVLDTGEAHIGHETPAMLRNPDSGEERLYYYNFIYAPLRNVDGEVDGVLATAFDVTEQVNARERIEGLRQQAEEASRAKDEFPAMLSHELRNPLAPIVTALELMRMRDPEALPTEREVIERQAQQLTRLVDDLMDVSRITRGKIALRRAPVALDEILQSAVETASPLLEERRHRLSRQVEPGLWLDGDAPRLTQVLSNLLTNAAKYTDPGGHITLRAHPRGEQVVIEVEDNGVGMDPELMPRIFDMFAQRAQGIERSQGGLGLGLAIVRSLVQQHGGQIEAHSDGPGCGSTFRLTLPQAEAPVDGAGTHADAPPATHTQQPYKVLVVDDNRDAAEGLSEYLSDLGHQTRIALDGPNALRAAAEMRPDVVLLDLGLPVIDGFEVARRLRAMPDLHHTRIVAVTGYGQQAERERTTEVGFTAHLVKPVNVREVAALISSLPGTVTQN